MHIDYPTLSAFADGDLDRAHSEAVSTHLRTCATCRAEVQFIRSLGDGLRGLQTPLAPRNAIDAILPKARDTTPVSGLPLEGRKPTRRGSVLALAASVVGLLVTALVLTFGAGRVAAGSSSLTLEPARGGAMTVQYETISALAGERRVRARIRYWVPDPLRFVQNDGGFHEIELARTAPGRFEGVAGLPPGAVYAAATVEALDGSYVESDFGRFWEYLETGADGRPTLQARRYQVLAALEFNVPRAARLAELGSTEFPGESVFWLWRLSFELASLPSDGMDTLLPDHMARLDELDRAARAENPGAVEIDALSRYAELLERPEIADYWRGELRARHPRHDATSLVNLQEIQLSGTPIEARLAALEEDWTSLGTPATAQVGLRYSYGFADPALTGRWLDRYEASSAGRTLSSDTEVARNMMEVPALWPVAEGWILDRLSFSGDWVGPARRLDQSRYNFEAETHESRANLYLDLSRVRLGLGDAAGAIEALERSVEEAWNPRVFARAAEIYRSLGSDERAAELIALAQADPIAAVEPYLSPGADAERRELTDAQRVAAQAAMRERILSGLLDEYVNLEVPLRTEAGDGTTLERTVGTDPGAVLVVYTIRPDVVPEEVGGLLASNAGRLTSAGVRTVCVAAEQHASPVDCPGSDIRFHHDPDHDVWNELRAWRSFQYFVLDRGGRLRHRGEDLETALRIALVLAM